MSQKLFATALFMLFFTVGLLPLLMMVYDASLTGIGFYGTIFKTKGVVESFANSTLLALVVATLTTVFGTVMAFFLVKTEFFFSKIFLSLFAVPLLLPPYVVALGWIDLVGGVEVINRFLFGFFGTAFVLFSIYLPIPLLLAFFFLKQVDPQLERAGLLFCNAKKTMFTITLPLIYPAVVLGFLLVFILTFGEYSVANVLRFSVFPLKSFTQFSAFYDFDSAVILAMPMLLIAIIVILIEQFYIAKKSFKYKSYGDATLFVLTKRERLFLFFAFAFAFFIIVVLPLASLFCSIKTVDIFYEALQKGADPLVRSLLFAFFGAFLLMFFGFLSGYVLFLKIPFLSRALESSALFVFVLPATVFGIALILFFNRPLIDFVYTTPLIILVGYFGKYLAPVAKIVQTKLVSISYSMIEAAQILGADWFSVLRYILIPLSKKVIVAIFVVGFIFSLRESTITMLVYPPGYETLPIYTVTQMANGKEGIIASLSVIMIVISLAPFLLFYLFKGKKYD